MFVLCSKTPCRRATAAIFAPGSKLSAKIRARSSSLLRIWRGVPVIKLDAAIAIIAFATVLRSVIMTVILHGDILKWSRAALDARRDFPGGPLARASEEKSRVGT